MKNVYEFNYVSNNIAPPPTSIKTKFPLNVHKLLKIVNQRKVYCCTI